MGYARRLLRFIFGNIFKGSHFATAPTLQYVAKWGP